MKIEDLFTEDDMVIVFEAARVVLADAEVFDKIAEELDLSDEEMIKIRDKIQFVMDEDEKSINSLKKLVDYENNI